MPPFVESEELTIAALAKTLSIEKMSPGGLGSGLLQALSISGFSVIGVAALLLRRAGLNSAPRTVNSHDSMNRHMPSLSGLAHSIREIRANISKALTGKAILGYIKAWRVECRDSLGGSLLLG